MTFISYAQNLEDVMLWRVFKNIQHGFYIDVGAHDPDNCSVTKAFYERGWRGINIEPVKNYYERFVQHRPGDINLNIGISDKEGATTGSAKALFNICSAYVRQAIHFLKIDAEGVEKLILEGMNFKLYRPWVVLVKSMLSFSQQENSQSWESILLENSYQFVYFDGLNKFYVAGEHSELASKFYAPPNVFDGYIRDIESAYNIQKNINKDNELKNKLAKQIQKNKQLNAECRALRQINSQREAFIRQLLSSKSWNITRPLRQVAAYIKRVFKKENISPAMTEILPIKLMSFSEDVNGVARKILVRVDKKLAKAFQCANRDRSHV